MGAVSALALVTSQDEELWVRKNGSIVRTHTHASFLELLLLLMLCLCLDMVAVVLMVGACVDLVEGRIRVRERKDAMPLVALDEMVMLGVEV